MARDVLRQANHWGFPQPSALVARRQHTHTPHTTAAKLSQYIMKRFPQTSGAERGRGGDFERADTEVNSRKAVIYRQR